MGSLLGVAGGLAAFVVVAIVCLVGLAALTTAVAVRRWREWRALDETLERWRRVPATIESAGVEADPRTSGFWTGFVWLAAFAWFVALGGSAAVYLEARRETLARGCGGASPCEVVDEAVRAGRSGATGNATR